VRAGTVDPRVAVVMITHNRMQEVLTSLRQLARLPERPRIVVIDNGSDDGTPAAVADRFPQVEVIEAGKNLGAAARTLGVRHVDAPYIAFCDDDTWWDPGCLRRAADLFDAQPRLAVITGRVLVGPEDREDPICSVLARSPLPRKPGMPGPALLGFLAGASVVRRSALLEVGGFEPRFFIGGEEELVAVDLAARDWWLCYVAELIVHHHPSARRDASARHSTIARNAIWFAWLRRPISVALRKTLQPAWRRPRDRDTWRTLAECLRGLPWAMTRRRTLPREVERGLRLLEAHADVP
jgi:GT2 family glycosyltransferase